MSAGSDTRVPAASSSGILCTLLDKNAPGKAAIMACDNNVPCTTGTAGCLTMSGTAGAMSYAVPFLDPGAPAYTGCKIGEGGSATCSGVPHLMQLDADTGGVTLFGFNDIDGSTPLASVLVYNTGT